MTNLLKQIATSLSVLALLLTVLPAPTTNAAFPGLDGRLLYVSDIDGDAEIYSKRLDGSDLKQLTSNSAVDGAPRWSADGKKVVFISSRDGGNEELYIMDADGGNQTRITNNGFRDLFPAFSPDGSKIYFESDRGGGTREDFYVISVDGTNTVQLTNDSTRDRLPDVSPDGLKIAYRSDSHPGDLGFEIYIVNTDGTNKTRLTNIAGSDVNASFSPDSNHIVFYSARDGTAEIYTMNSDGSNQTRVTNDAFADTAPTFYPSGEKIVYESNRSGNLDIYTINRNGTGSAPLVVSSSNDSYPSIQPLTISPSTLDQDIVLDATDDEAVTYDPVSNHTDTYEDIDPSSVTITTEPEKGTAEVNNTTGEITYTPDSTSQANVSTGSSSSLASFIASINNLFSIPAHAQTTSQDYFTYQICSTANSELCTENTVSVDLASATASSADTDASLAETGISQSFLVLMGTGITVFGIAALSLFKFRIRTF